MDTAPSPRPSQTGASRTDGRSGSVDSKDRSQLQPMQSEVDLSALTQGASSVRRHDRESLWPQQPFEPISFLKNEILVDGMQVPSYSYASYTIKLIVIK